MLDKIDQPMIPDGYGVSVAFHSLLEIVTSVRFLILGDVEEKGQGQDQARGHGQAPQAVVKGLASRKGEQSTTAGMHTYMHQFFVVVLFVFYCNLKKKKMCDGFCSPVGINHVQIWLMSTTRLSCECS